MAHLVFIVVLCDEIGEGPQSEFLQAGCGDEEDAAVVGLCIPWVRSLCPHGTMRVVVLQPVVTRLLVRQK